MNPESTVVKREQVQATGRRRVGPQPAAPPPAAKKAQGGKAAARVVEQDDAGALIEVTCPCGQKVYVQCDYAPAG